MLKVLRLIAVELVAGVSLNYDKNACEQPSTCKKASLRFQILLRDMIHNSICLILMENWHESPVLQTCGVFQTP